MKIGVIADSHDHLPPLRRAVAMLKRMKVDAVLHAGDYVAPFAARELAGPNLPPSIPLHCIYGNNDGERAGLRQILPQLVDGPFRLELGGKTIVMHHWIEQLSDADVQGADIVVTGHTHEVVNEVRDGVLQLNPGECCGWLTDRCTIALLDTDAMEAQIVEVHP